MMELLQLQVRTVEKSTAIRQRDITCSIVRRRPAIAPFYCDRHTGAGEEPKMVSKF